MKNYPVDIDTECTYDERLGYKNKRENKRHRNESERQRREYLEDMDYED